MFGFSAAVLTATDRQPPLDGIAGAVSTPTGIGGCGVVFLSPELMMESECCLHRKSISEK